jgi:urease accessory protein
VTLQRPISPEPAFQRARGRLGISAVCEDSTVTRLKNLRQDGSYRAIFPRSPHGKLDAVLINTAGGITGGDQFSVSATAHEKAQVTITTQAAERIYRATAGDAGQMTNQLSVAKDAQFFWVPQETILFEGCRFKRSLEVDVDPSATFLMVEPLVFGREASGENLRDCAFQDRVYITSDGQPIYHDRIQMNGDLAAMLIRPAMSGGARAMANLVFVDPNAQNMLSACRDVLPQTAGASLLSDRVLVVRLLAQDSFALRKALLPILKLFTNDTVPKNWRL